jgi:NADH dehydrogenase
MNNDSAKAPHVVIVGGGFGGIRAATQLSKAPVNITLIDRRNHHLFQPLLYQVAMAGLSPSDIAYPIRSILRHQQNAKVLLDEVRSVDVKNRTIQLIDSTLSYDYLILATGSQNSYFGHDEWMKFAIGLKDLDDAVEIRRRVLLAFEAAERETCPNERKRLLTFLLIGGGPTGVELAGSLAELARSVLACDFRNIKSSSAEIILLDGGKRILSAYDDSQAGKAQKQLEKLGVQVRSQTRVTKITADGVVLGSEFIPSATVIWCGGVKATPLTETLGAKVDRAGRVEVDKDLSLPGHREVFVIGDACVFLHQDGKPLPGLAPVAKQQGQAAARSIADDLSGRQRKTFCYRHQGSLATIGRRAAIADFGRIRLSGSVAWLTWLFVHVFFLIGFRNRFVVLFNWFWSYVSFQRGARLITGQRLNAGIPEPSAPTAGQPAQAADCAVSPSAQSTPGQVSQAAETPPPKASS